MHSQVEFLGAKFQLLNCLPSRTYGPGRPHVGLCPIFLVVVVVGVVVVVLVVVVVVAVVVVVVVVAVVAVHNQLPSQLSLLPFVGW